jgi:hypothetical protein
MEDKEKLMLGNPESGTLNIMKQLAGDTELSDISYNSDELLDRSRIFLIAQAKYTLSRIIRLTNFLEKMESKFIEAVDSRIETEPDNLSVLTVAMETVSKLLYDANTIVTQVLKDDKLQLVINNINTTSYVTPDGKSATIIDADSRDAVRNFASSLLASLQSAENGEEVIDVDVSDDIEGE